MRPSDAHREEAVARLMREASREPGRLRALLTAMPKGGELHVHSWGTATAADQLRWGAAEGFCASARPPGFVPPPCEGSGVPLASAVSASARSALAGALTEDAEAGPVRPRHDRFFASFGVTAPLISRSLDRELALLRERAAAQSVSYVEFMSNPAALDALGARMARQAFDPRRLDRAFAAIRPLLPAMLARSRAEVAARWRAVDRIEGCGRRGTAAPACSVSVRFLATATRNDAPASVFAELAGGFYLARHLRDYVGVNILGPEDEKVALADYGLHMRMIRYLAHRFPGVPVSLHAGELTPALAPAPALTDHVAQAVAAGAARIGHGVDIAGERDATATIARMASRRIALEANLTSNAVILGVAGREHPLRRYLAAGVPVVLSTDDPGVLRTDLTREYERAVLEQGLDYRDLKRIARNGLEYSFLPGASLWRAGGIGRLDGACARPTAARCATLLRNSAKARLQWRLERDLDRFERRAVGETRSRS